MILHNIREITLKNRVIFPNNFGYPHCPIVSSTLSPEILENAEDFKRMRATDPQQRKRAEAKEESVTCQGSNHVVYSDKSV